MCGLNNMVVWSLRLSLSEVSVYPLPRTVVCVPVNGSVFMQSVMHAVMCAVIHCIWRWKNNNNQKQNSSNNKTKRQQQQKETKTKTKRYTVTYTNLNLSWSCTSRQSSNDLEIKLKSCFECNKICTMIINPWVFAMADTLIFFHVHLVERCISVRRFFFTWVYNFAV